MLARAVVIIQKGYSYSAPNVVSPDPKCSNSNFDWCFPNFKGWKLNFHTFYAKKFPILVTNLTFEDCLHLGTCMWNRSSSLSRKLGGNFFFPFFPLFIFFFHSQRGNFYFYGSSWFHFFSFLFFFFLSVKNEHNFLARHIENSFEGHPWGIIFWSKNCTRGPVWKHPNCFKAWPSFLFKVVFFVV